MPTRNKVFLDSNFFIYLFDKGDAGKQAHCIKLLKKLEKEAMIVLSTQVVKEVCAILLKKLNYPIHDLKLFLALLENYEIVETPISTVQSALDVMLTNQLSFWDALIVASANAANCETLMSEDLNHGQRILGMIIRNPFRS